MKHELKTWPKYYKELTEGRKTFELRKNDRMFEVGDILRLKEFDPATKEYTGRWQEYEVTGIFGDEPNPFGIDFDGYVILSIKAKYF